MKKMNKWKDRGWWASVEIDSRQAGKKNHQKALILLNGAQERYDLIHDDGKTTARAIFTRDSDMLGLAKLIEVAGHWARTIVHVNGNKLDSSQLGYLYKQLKCAENQAYCRLKNGTNQPAFLGCRFSQIGILDYSLDSLKNGARYWFSYFQQENGSAHKFLLNRPTLLKTVLVSANCPFFPENTEALLEKLPGSIDLNLKTDIFLWIPTQLRIRSRWLCRYPPVVPKNPTVYEQWIANLLSNY